MNDGVNRPYVRASAGLVTLLIGVACVACGGSSSARRSMTAPATPPPTTATATAPTPQTTAASSPPPTTVTTPPPAKPNPTHTGTCLDTGITVTATGPGYGLGHAGVTSLFTNTGAAPCTLHGYPRVAVLDATGHQIVQAQRTFNGDIGGVLAGGEPTVVLQHGQMASALVEGGVPASNSSCQEEHGLLVTPPGGTIPTQLTATLGVHCTDVQVHPVVSGTNGDAPPQG